MSRFVPDTSCWNATKTRPVLSAAIVGRVCGRASVHIATFVPNGRSVGSGPGPGGGGGAGGGAGAGRAAGGGGGAPAGAARPGGPRRGREEQDGEPHDREQQDDRNSTIATSN